MNAGALLAILSSADPSAEVFLGHVEGAHYAELVDAFEERGRLYLDCDGEPVAHFADDESAELAGAAASNRVVVYDAPEHAPARRAPGRKVRR